MVNILTLLKNVRGSGTGWMARCPAHDDKHNSLKVDRGEGNWLLKCHAGCKIEDIAASIGLTTAELFDNGASREGALYASRNRATAQPSSAPGLTLENYAKAKRLPLNLLRGCGLSQIAYDGAPAVRIPYLGPGGELLAVRFRIALEGDRFRWSSINRRSPGASLTPLIAAISATSKIRKAGRPGSLSATRYPTSWRCCPRQSGCAVARLLMGIENPTRPYSAAPSAVSRIAPMIPSLRQRTGSVSRAFTAAVSTLGAPPHDKS
jgi:hypothetical protein